jgi:hypothetical protein
MRIFIVTLSFSLALHAADKFQPLNIKPGLWEVTTTETTNELPIPAGILQKLTPEQRTRIEERIEARKSESGRIITKKQCLTREQIDHGIPFGVQAKSCTRTVVTSRLTEVEMQVQCLEHGVNTEGTVQIEVLSSENVKGSTRFSKNQENAPGPPSTFTAKWIGPVCTPSKCGQRKSQSY